MRALASGARLKLLEAHNSMSSSVTSSCLTLVFPPFYKIVSAMKDSWSRWAYWKVEDLSAKAWRTGLCKAALLLFPLQGKSSFILAIKRGRIHSPISVWSIQLRVQLESGKKGRGLRCSENGSAGEVISGGKALAVHLTNIGLVKSKPHFCLPRDLEAKFSSRILLAKTS